MQGLSWAKLSYQLGFGCISSYITTIPGGSGWVGRNNLDYGNLSSGELD